MVAWPSASIDAVKTQYNLANPNVRVVTLMNQAAERFLGVTAGGSCLGKPLSEACRIWSLVDLAREAAAALRQAGYLVVEAGDGQVEHREDSQGRRGQSVAEPLARPAAPRPRANPLTPSGWVPGRPLPACIPRGRDNGRQAVAATLTSRKRCEGTQHRPEPMQ